MSFFEKIKEFGLDPNTIQNGLKNIGVDLTKYKLETESISEDLVKTLKKIADVAKTASRQDKMFLRSNFETALKGKTVKVYEKPSLIEKTEVNPVNEKTKAPKQDYSKPKAILPWWGNQKLKIGKVKFFSSDKGFGFIESFDDKKDCFGHISHLLVKAIEEGDLVNFESGPSKKKEGELAAYSINTQFELYIDNNIHLGKSVAYILTQRHHDKPFVLIEKINPGFYVGTLKAKGISYQLTILPDQNVDQKSKLAIGKEILENYLKEPKTYLANISWLLEILWELLSEEDKKVFIDKIQPILDSLDLVSIDKFIDSFSFQEVRDFVFKRERDTIDQIMFLFWWKNLTNNLPSNQTTQFNEVLNQFDFKNVQSVFKRLLEENKYPEYIDICCHNLFRSEFVIHDIHSYVIVAKLLLQYTLIKPAFRISEDDVLHWDTQFKIKLHDDGLLPILKEETIKEYVGSLKTIEEKSNFIKTLPEEVQFNYFRYFPELDEEFNKLVKSKIDSLIAEIPFVGFDLETKGDEICI